MGKFRWHLPFKHKQKSPYPITEQTRPRVNAYSQHLVQSEAEKLVSLELAHEHGLRLTKIQYDEMHSLREKFNKAVK